LGFGCEVESLSQVVWGSGVRFRVCLRLFGVSGWDLLEVAGLAALAHHLRFHREGVSIKTNSIKTNWQ